MKGGRRGMKGSWGAIELTLILTMILAVAVLVIFNLTVSNNLVKWQSVKTCFYIAHHISAPPVSCEKGIVTGDSLNFITTEDFKKLSVFATLYDIDSRTIIKKVYQDDSPPDFVKTDLEERIEGLLDFAAGEIEGNISLPSGATGEFKDPKLDITKHMNLFYMYTLPVVIGCEPDSRKMGYLTVGTFVNRGSPADLTSLFCYMVEKTGVQREIYWKDCGLPEVEEEEP